MHACSRWNSVKGDLLFSLVALVNISVQTRYLSVVSIDLVYGLHDLVLDNAKTKYDSGNKWKTVSLWFASETMSVSLALFLIMMESLWTQA